VEVWLVDALPAGVLDPIVSPSDARQNQRMRLDEHIEEGPGQALSFIFRELLNRGAASIVAGLI